MLCFLSNNDKFMHFDKTDNEWYNGIMDKGYRKVTSLCNVHMI